MPYQTDYPPITYLERRIIYYKKVRGRIGNYLKRFGGKKNRLGVTQKDIDNRVKEINDRIAEYQSAIKILKSLTH